MLFHKEHFRQVFVQLFSGFHLNIEFFIKKFAAFMLGLTGSLSFLITYQ